MKTAILFPGTGESDESVWFPYLIKDLSEKNFGVKTIIYPNSDKPLLSECLEVALHENYNESTILIGHSAGVALILAVLEKIEVRVKQVILVAGYVKPLTAYDDANLILKPEYNWEKIKANSESFVIINSVNDPWGCDDTQGREIFDHTGGVLVINEDGHMGSETYNQPYKEFPLLLKLIKN